MNTCTHPDHNDSETCEDRAVGCDKNCTCCMGKMGELQYCNLDTANYLLSQGRATKENAEAFVEMWNKPGHRSTIARLEEKPVNRYGTTFLRLSIEIE